MTNEIHSFGEIVEKIVIERNKKVNDLIFGEIQQIAKENGIDTKIVINEKAIISALEKQIPKRPKTLKTHDISNYKYGDCECGEHIHDDERYCSSCGQALDWSDTE